MTFLMGILLLAGNVAAGPLLERPWENYFEALRSDFKSIYALAEFKRDRFGWERESEFILLRDRLVDRDPTDGYAVRQAFRSFFRRTRDYHAGVYFQSAWDSSELPFGIRTVGGRAIVTFVDRKLAPTSDFPARVGDELVRFGGKPVTEALNRLILRPLNQVATDLAYADRYLTRRPGYENFPLPTGKIRLEFRRRETGEPIRFDWAWKKVATVPTREIFTRPRGDRANVPQELAARFDRRTHAFRAVERVDLINEIGHRDPFVPEIGKLVWRSDPQQIFFAEISRTEAGARVGLIRIPTYYPDEPEKALVEFNELIGRMQEKTDVLVLDQTNNGGGSVLYFYELLAHLISKPVPTTLRFRWSLQPMNFHLGEKWADLEAKLRDVTTDADARRVLGDHLGGYPVDRTVARGVYREAKTVLTAMEQGKKRTTGPIPLFFIDEVRPKGNVYRKPIVLLANEWSFSAADMAAAMLQDLRRVTVFGARTAGAGAYTIQREPAENPYGIWFHSLSMAEVTRAEDHVIENVGVVPNVKYDLTVEDLRSGYQGYRRKLVQVVNEKADLK